MMAYIGHVLHTVYTTYTCFVMLHDYLFRECEECVSEFGECVCFVVFIVLSREEYNVGPVCSSPVVLLLALFPTPQTKMLFQPTHTHTQPYFSSVCRCV